jgi:uncharacterized membrane protein
MKKLLVKFIFSLSLLSFFTLPNISFARERVTDWYIQDFNLEITVNKDSSLNITEVITADCGKAAGKHGIFRILPNRMNVGGEIVKTPIKLTSITDANNKELKYKETKSLNDGTVTWKIGDPNITIQGVNIYKIKYRIGNVIRFENKEFDELYWNLNGNFWDLETDSFHAKLIFPKEITSSNSKVDYYTGFSGEKNKDLAKYFWSTPSTLNFSSTKTLKKKQGITASIVFPKNIMSKYEFGFWELYGNYFYFLIPIFVFLICFLLWKKYGDDPKLNKPIIAEYLPPDNLSPIELGMVMTNGVFKHSFITAEIINLATKGFIKITETEKEGLVSKILNFGGKEKDYDLERIDSGKDKPLSSMQMKILTTIFLEEKKVKLSSLKSRFYKSLGEIKKETNRTLLEKGLLEGRGRKIGRIMFLVAFIAMLFVFIMASGRPSLPLFLSIISSWVIVIIFGFSMPKRTLKGTELNLKIKGFKLFMDKAEKYRARFYEKENIFEELLPYAITFAITKLWIKKMDKIYGEEFYSNYSPVWYSGSMSSFSLDSLTTTIEGISSEIGASTASPSNSGAGGSGGSGGGGGGGGGGGW